MKKERIIKVKLQKDYELVKPRRGKKKDSYRIEMLSKIQRESERDLWYMIGDLYTEGEWYKFSREKRTNIAAEVVYTTALHVGLNDITQKEISVIISWMDLGFQ